MQQFLQSHFLQALAYSLVASIWQMALLWLITIVLLKLFKLSSAQKFRIAFVAQISGFVLFVFNCFHVYNTAAEKIIINTNEGSFLFRASTIVDRLMPYAAVIYLCILVFKLLKLAFNYNDTKSLRADNLKKISADKRIFVQEMSALFSLRKKVSIYLSEKVGCPLTIGFLKPMILIPVAAINHLTAEQMEAVILHELAHIKRADYLLFILENLIERFFFFNIFSIMLANIIERERENACDDWVLQFRYNSQHYAEALFKLGRLKALPALAIPFTGKKESLLLTRIKRLLHSSQKKQSYNLQPVLFGALSIVVMIGLMVSVSSKPAITKSENIAYTNVATQPEVAVTTTNAVITSNKKADNFKKQTLHNTEKNLSADKMAATNTLAELNQQQFALAQAQENYQQQKQNYLLDVKQKLDSLKVALPKYQEALNSQLIVTPDVLRKVTSYQNFKQIEDMLTASGDSIKVTETDASKNSYQKEVTIEAKDKNGNKHIYTVIVQLYQ